MREFKVRNKDNAFYVRVVIYDSLKEMREAADKHNLERGMKADNVKDKVLGVSHHYVGESIKEDGSFARMEDCGTIRLSKTHLAPLIVAHELVHASMWIYRLKYGTDRDDGSGENADFGDQVSELEEKYAHIYGQMLRDMVRKLYKYGLW